MIDWAEIMNRKPEKTVLELEYETMSQKYFDTFGEYFPVQYPPSHMADDIEAMRQCIESGEKRDGASVNNETDVLT